MVGRYSPLFPRPRLLPPDSDGAASATVERFKRRSAWKRGSGGDCTWQHPGVVGWLVGSVVGWTLC